MKTATALVGVVLLAALAGCTKKESTDEAAADKAAQAPAKEAALPPRKTHAEKAASLMVLISTSPECQPFRDRLEAMGKVPDDQELSNDAMSMIVAEAHKAGCSR
jgi:Flp pilus assembly protein TadD